MKNRTLHYLIRFLVGEDAPSEIVESIGYTNDSNRFDKYNVVIIPSGFFDEHIYGTPASMPQLPLREVQGIPLGELFFMEGMAGDYIAYVMVFDPLPLELTKITYIAPAGEPFKAWGADWSGSVKTLDIKQLRENQKLFEYQERVVVE